MQQSVLLTGHMSVLLTTSSWDVDNTFQHPGGIKDNQMGFVWKLVAVGAPKLVTRQGHKNT